MNFGELIQAAWREFGYQGVGPSNPTSTVLKERRAIDWVQQAHADIQKLWHDWDFLWAEGQFSAVADQRDYTKPTAVNFYEEDTFRIGDDKLQPVSFIDYRRDRSVYDSDVTGRPEAFVILPNRSVRFLPTPDQAYTIDYEYYRTPLVLSGTSDSPLIPLQFHDVIIWRAKMLFAQFEDAPAELQNAAQLYSEALTRLQAAQLPAYDKMHGRASGVDFVVRPE